METYYKSVGRNSTLLLNFPIVTATALRFNIDESKACPLISTVSLFLAPDII